MRSTFSQALFWVWVIEIAVSGFNYFYLMNRVYQPKYGELIAHQIGMSVRIVYILGFAAALIHSMPLTINLEQIINGYMHGD